MFLHAGFGHVFFNMLSLYIFGPRLEAQLGGRSFVALYLISGIAGGLLSLPFSPMARIVGASGAIMGVMYGFARYWPRERIMVWFTVLEARYAVLLFIGLDLFAGFGGGSGNIAHFAHLGGAAAGFVYLQLADLFSRRRKFEAKLRTPRVSRAISPVGRASNARPCTRSTGTSSTASCEKSRKKVSAASRPENGPFWIPSAIALGLLNTWR